MILRGWVRSDDCITIVLTVAVSQAARKGGLTCQLGTLQAQQLYGALGPGARDPRDAGSYVSSWSPAQEPQSPQGGWHLGGGGALPQLTEDRTVLQPHQVLCHRTAVGFSTIICAAAVQVVQ